MKKNNNIYLKLFLSTFYISAFTFGGGYVIISIMKKKFVDEYKWIDEKEVLNLTAIAQSSPGPVAVNTSILLGYKIAGVLGGAVALLGTILPPLIIITVISFFYSSFRDNKVVSAVLKGMQSGVAAVIADVVVNLGINVVKEKDIISDILMIGAFIAVFFFKINIIIIILACACFGALRSIYQNKKVKEAQIK